MPKLDYDLDDVLELIRSAGKHGQLSTMALNMLEHEFGIRLIGNETVESATEIAKLTYLYAHSPS